MKTTNDTTGTAREVFFLYIGGEFEREYKVRAAALGARNRMCAAGTPARVVAARVTLGPTIVCTNDEVA